MFQIQLDAGTTPATHNNIYKKISKKLNKPEELKTIRVKNIKYYGTNKNLPDKLTLDISKYNDIPKGFGNLNCKVYRAIKEKTGREAISCQLVV